MRAINTPMRTILQGIRGERVPVGIANILVPFTRLKIIADVEFPILKEDLPSLLGMK